MGWIFFLALQVIVIVSGIRQEQREGLWNWSKFVFAIGFGALEFALIFIPLTYLNPHTRYYQPVWITACVIAALNFIWMIIVARRWKLPDGRTSLQAYRDEHPK
jgi:Na+/melibiose symporter-like transporter